MMKQLSGSKKIWFVLAVIGIVLALVLRAGAITLYRYTNYNPKDMFLDQNPYRIEEAGTNGNLSIDEQKYTYNSDIVTVLLLGIDKTNQRGINNITDNGYQADTVFAAAINTKTSEITLISIPRDTLTDVMCFDRNGRYATTLEKPLCVAHSYGDGGIKSGQLMEASVSNLLGGVPVSRYISMDIDGINAAAGLMGGVQVEMLDDFTMVDPDMKKGELFTLDENTAEWYVRSRQLPGMSGENINRVPRQMQFVDAFIRIAKDKAKSNPFFLFTFLSEMKQYMGTDMSAKELMFTASSILSAGQDQMKIINLDGQQTKEGYVVDQESLGQLVKEIYFVPAG